MNSSYIQPTQESLVNAAGKVAEYAKYATEVGSTALKNVQDAASFVLYPKNGYVGAGSFVSSSTVNYYATVYGPQALAKSWQQSVVSTLSPYVSTPIAKGVAFLTTPKAVTTLSPAVTTVATLVAVVATVAIGNAISSYFWG